MKVTLSVNQRHIAEGRRYAANACPIALALRDKGFTNVCVGNISANFIHKQKVFTVTQLSERAQKFIARVDGCKLVKPFRFQLTASAD